MWKWPLHLRVHNKTDSYDIPLTISNIHILTHDNTIDNNEDIFLKMIEFTMGNELRELGKKVDTSFDAFTTRKEELIDIDALNIVNNWATTSTKFKEWIAPEWKFNCDGVSDLLNRIAKKTKTTDRLLSS